MIMCVTVCDCEFNKVLMVHMIGETDSQSGNKKKSVPEPYSVRHWHCFTLGGESMLKG